MIEQNDEWVVGRRYMNLESLAPNQQRSRHQAARRGRLINSDQPGTDCYTTPRGTI